MILLRRKKHRVVENHVIEIGGSVIPAAVKTPDNKFARIIKSGRNMPAVKTLDNFYLTHRVYKL